MQFAEWIEYTKARCWFTASFAPLSGVPLRPPPPPFALHFHSKPSRRDFDIAGSSVGRMRERPFKAVGNFPRENVVLLPSFFTIRSNKHWSLSHEKEMFSELQTDMIIDIDDHRLELSQAHSICDKNSFLSFIYI